MSFPILFAFVKVEPAVHGIGFTFSLNDFWSNSKRSKLFLCNVVMEIASMSEFWKFAFFNIAS